MWCGQRLVVADLVCYWRFSTEKKWIMVCRLFSMSRSHVYRDHLNTATSCQASVPGILFRESCDMLLTVIVFECSVLLPPKNIYASWHGDLCEVGVFDFRLVTCLWFWRMRDLVGFLCAFDMPSPCELESSPALTWCFELADGGRNFDSSQEREPSTLIPQNGV